MLKRGETTSVFGQTRSEELVREHDSGRFKPTHRGRGYKLNKDMSGASESQEERTRQTEERRKSYQPAREPANGKAD